MVHLVAKSAIVFSLILSWWSAESCLICNTHRDQITLTFPGPSGRAFISTLTLRSALRTRLVCGLRSIMASIENSALPPGSTVLVTGVNGLIGSHVAEQLLAHGYKVRGTVRDTQKSSWTLDFFGKKFGPGLFELIQVRDITEDGAFDEALRGTSQLRTWPGNG